MVLLVPWGDGKPVRQGRMMADSPVHTAARDPGASVGLMVPLLILHLIMEVTVYGPLGTTPIAFIIFYAWFVGGFLEEVLKYTSIRAIYTKDLVADPRALLVYAAATSNGFALVENLTYVFRGPPMAGVIRAIVSVPCHTSWGLISGARLGERKFFEHTNKWYYNIALPVLLHGCYNFPLLLYRQLPQTTTNFIACQSTTLVIALISLALCRKCFQLFDSIDLVDVLALQEANIMDTASCRTCCKDDCSQLCWDPDDRSQRERGRSIRELTRAMERGIQARGHNHHHVPIAVPALASTTDVPAWGLSEKTHVSQTQSFYDSNIYAA